MSASTDHTKETRILEKLDKADRPVSIRDLSRLLEDIPRRTISHHVRRLVDQKILQKSFDGNIPVFTRVGKHKEALHIIEKYRERHLQDLKSILMAWLDELPDFDRYYALKKPSLNDLVEGEVFNGIATLRIERHQLFDDLKVHFQETMEKWSKFKDFASEYEEKYDQLHLLILQKMTRLGLRSSRDLSWWLVTALVSGKKVENTKNSLFIEVPSMRGIVHTRYTTRTLTGTEISTTLLLLDEMKSKQEVSEISEIKERLWTLRNELIHDIKRIQYKERLPGECDVY